MHGPLNVKERHFMIKSYKNATIDKALGNTTVTESNYFF